MSSPAGLGTAPSASAISGSAASRATHAELLSPFTMPPALAPPRASERPGPSCSGEPAGEGRAVQSRTSVLPRWWLSQERTRFHLPATGADSTWILAGGRAAARCPAVSDVAVDRAPGPPERSPQGA
eukprot:6460806-Alexandrium_andersonii.AAC.1